MPKIVV